jgi:hypothetical protein
MVGWIHAGKIPLTDVRLTGSVAKFVKSSDNLRILEIERTDD